MLTVFSPADRAAIAGSSSGWPITHLSRPYPHAASLMISMPFGFRVRSPSGPCSSCRPDRATSTTISTATSPDIGNTTPRSRPTS